MRKIVYLSATYAVCRFLGIENIWSGFAFSLLIMLFFRIPDTVLWEIPIGALVCAISLSAAGEDTATLIRILIPSAAVIIAFSSPSKLFFFFPMAVCALFFKNIFFTAALFASLWYAIRLLFIKNYFNIEKKILQAHTD